MFTWEQIEKAMDASNGNIAYQISHALWKQFIQDMKKNLQHMFSENAFGDAECEECGKPFDDEWHSRIEE